MMTLKHNKRLSGFLVFFLVVVFSSLPSQADIYEWEYVDSGDLSLGKRESSTLVPGGLGVEAIPEAELFFLDLTMAYLINKDLTGAEFSGVKLADADLTGANLTAADLRNVVMTGANFTNAQIRGALFFVNADTDITTEQFYSTASYRTKDLSRIYLERSNLSGWNFSGQNLTRSRFDGANLTSANLANANFTDAYLGSSVLTNADLSGANLYSAGSYEATWTDTNLSGADVRGASFGRFKRGTGITTVQLYSTASYQDRDLTGIGLSGNDLTAWDFSHQNLTNATFNNAVMVSTNLANAILNEARFFEATLTDADFSGVNLTDASFRDTRMERTNFSGATINGASFLDVTDSGFTSAQLYSTASYQAKDLTRVILGTNDLIGWNFAEQNLTYARFGGTTLTSTDFTSANLTNARFSGAVLDHARFAGANLTDVEFEEASLVYANLAGANLTNVDFEKSALDNANLTRANLSEIDFVRSTLTNTILSGANLTGAFFFSSTTTGADLTGADLRAALFDDLSSALTDNAIQPDGRIHGLNLAVGQKLLVRDYDGNPFTFTPIAPIPITIEQQLFMDTGGELQFVFEADHWDSLISFQSNIPVRIEGGILNLDFTDEVDAATQIGRSFQIFDWAGVSPTGKFSVHSQYQWDLSRLYSTGEVTLLAVPEPTALVLMGLGVSVTVLSGRCSQKAAVSRKR